MREATPSWNEIAAIVATMAPRAPAPPPTESGFAKIGIGVATALITAILLWVGAGQSTLTTTVGAIAPKLDALQKQLDHLGSSVDTTQNQVNTQQITLGQQNLRVTALEQNQARLLDRMRAVEGGPRIAAPAPGTGGAP